MLIKHAQIANSQAVFDGDIRIEDGIITEIGSDLAPGNGEIIDARGLLAVPGGVDVHTHMDIDVGIAQASDDFYTGTVAAACGGTTTIVDHMGFGPKNCPLDHQLKVYHAKAEGKAVIDYGFHGVLQHVDDTVLADMERLIDAGLTSYKAYLTYDGKLDDAALFQVLRRCRELGIILTIHPENDGVVDFLKHEYVGNGNTLPKYHALSRPDTLEAEAINRMLLFAQQAGDAPLYVVHLTNALGLSFIEYARQHGQKHVYAETCPQYLLLDDSRYDDPIEGLKYIMSPPLRRPADNAALWAGLAGGSIQAVATDHCPFMMEQKLAGRTDFTKAPNGAPGVELRMILLYSEGVVKGRIDLPTYVRLMSARPAQLFGLNQKGDILPGKDGDILLIDPNAKKNIIHSLLHEHVDYTPYEGMEVTGWPAMTISRGEIIMRDGKFTGAKGRGRYIKRALPML